MFTGIITDLGRVREIAAGGESADTRVVIATGYDAKEISIGASIACSGVCLTVIERGPDWFAVEASTETLARTTLGDWRTCMPVNLERALQVGDALDGHIVTGHVDGVARTVERRREGGSTRFVFTAPAELRRFIAPKGSVALDGVSLTVNEVDDDRFGVNIIGHTGAVTRFGGLKPGDMVNIEVDLLARYVARLLNGE